MRPIVQSPFVALEVPASQCTSMDSRQPHRFDRMAKRLRRAGLVWAQVEPGHVRWSTAGDYLSTLVADSSWIQREVNQASERWSHGAAVQAVEMIPGCWLLPAGSRTRSDGLARGVAVAITRRATGSSGCLHALCQSARLDFELTRDLLLREPAIAIHEIPRLAAMVRLLQPVTLREASLPGVETLLRAVETTHRCVRGHCERTARLAARLASESGMSRSERETACLAGLLHDVGKLGVPQSILGKPGPLTSDERTLVNMHPEIGQGIVQGIGGLDRTMPAVLWHHERWDGAGYPHQLAGEKIPKVARLMAIVDSFDAMRSERPYRSILNPAAAMQEIKDGAGKQFDPVMADTFVHMIDREPALAA